jgi:hypothetical protein
MCFTSLTICPGEKHGLQLSPKGSKRFRLPYPDPAMIKTISYSTYYSLQATQATPKLRKTLVKSKFSSKLLSGTFPCQNKQCKLCPLIYTDNEIQIPNSTISSPLDTSHAVPRTLSILSGVIYAPLHITWVKPANHLGNNG